MFYIKIDGEQNKVICSFWFNNESKLMLGLYDKEDQKLKVPLSKLRTSRLTVILLEGIILRAKELQANKTPMKSPISLEEPMRYDHRDRE